MFNLMAQFCDAEELDIGEQFTRMAASEAPTGCTSISLLSFISRFLWHPQPLERVLSILFCNAFFDV